MVNAPSSWKSSLLRWAAYCALCAGLCVEFFAIDQAAMAVMSRVLALQAIARKEAGLLMTAAESNRVIQSYQTIFVFVLGILFVFLIGALDHYLSSGEHQGLLLKRIGVAAGIEAAVYLLTLAVPGILLLV